MPPPQEQNTKQKNALLPPPTSYSTYLQLLLYARHACTSYTINPIHHSYYSMWPRDKTKKSYLFSVVTTRDTRGAPPVSSVVSRGHSRCTPGIPGSSSWVWILRRVDAVEIIAHLILDMDLATGRHTVSIYRGCCCCLTLVLLRDHRAQNFIHTYPVQHYYQSNTSYAAPLPPRTNHTRCVYHIHSLYLCTSLLG